jgi:hypothetical protein
MGKRWPKKEGERRRKNCKRCGIDLSSPLALESWEETTVQRHRRVVVVASKSK